VLSEVFHTWFLHSLIYLEYNKYVNELPTVLLMFICLKDAKASVKLLEVILHQNKPNKLHFSKKQRLSTIVHHHVIV
jgi:hypothetical protein